MKKLLLILLLSTLSFCCKSQAYIPMLNSYAEWHVTNCYFGCITDRYYTIGDTSIAGYNYKFLDMYHYMKNFILREDTVERKIYMMFLGPSSKPPGDQLLYDFGMNIGDTIDVVNPNSPYPSSSGKFVLDSIKLKPLVVKPHRYFYLHALDTVTAGVKNTIWVEGIGSLCLINTPGAPPNINGVGQLSCFFNNGVKEYENLDSIMACQSVYPLSGVRENNKFKNSVIISPNPANNFFTIKANNYDFAGQKIEIINMFGKKEFEMTYYNSVNISSLSSGLYFLRFIINEQSYTFKFVRE